MNKFNRKLMLGIVALFSVAMLLAYNVSATTNSAPLTSVGKADIGGLPTCIYYSGASAAGPDDLVLTLPAGFTPREILFVPDMDTDSNIVHWFYGQASGTAFTHSNGTVAQGIAGGLLYAANGASNINIAVVAGTSVTLSNEAQVASQTYWAKVCR